MPPVSASYPPHLPIHIEGDRNFSSTNGVVRGTGAPADPFIIEHWDISAASGDGIFVRNTTASFVIRNVTVHSGVNSSNDGVVLCNVTNARIESTTATDNFHGIHVERSMGLLLINNTVSSDWNGFYLDSVSNVTLRGNLAEQNSDGVHILLSTSVVATENRFLRNVWGIDLETASDNITLENNEFSQNGIGISAQYQLSAIVISRNVLVGHDFGLWIGQTKNGTITDNTISDGRDGIAIWESDGLVIARNSIARNNRSGLSIVSSARISVYHNNFVSNAAQARDLSGTGSSWDDGYPSGGNYWSNYSGQDRCRGELQDDCSSPDGIGDAPMLVEGGPRDRYPLMTPYGQVTNPPSSLPFSLLLTITLTGAGAVILSIIAFLYVRRRARSKRDGNARR
ncbi:MAG TPA: NosD domain-containing protein [Thermoplasmata archaeon]